MIEARHRWPAGQVSAFGRRGAARRAWALGVGILLVGWVGCAAPLRTKPTAFADPALLSHHAAVGDLTLGVEVLETPEESKAAFGTDLAKADMLPVRLIARNHGTGEFEVDDRQVYGVLEDGRLAQAYNLRQAAQEVRESSIGTTVAAGAVVGAVAGAAVGAGVGAGIGHAAGDSSEGAASGAIIGATAGGAGGAAEGASDAITIEFRQQLADAQFGDQVLFAGNLKQGFVFLPRADYQALRVLVVDIAGRSQEEVLIPLR